jgi:multicomponent Na+:H+ antiporter subunit G
VNPFEVVAGLLVLVGSSLALVAGIGLVRMPDLFARMHAATKPATLGLVLVATGAVFRVATPGDATELVLVVALQFLTAPVASHLVGRAAYRAGISAPLELDELAGADDDRERPGTEP